MNNACTSRWCRRSRIIIKRQWRRFEKHPMRLFWWLTGIITAIFILCIIFARSSETAYTAFGSYFTALAFVGVIVTVLLQRAELQEQRKELRAQRRELEGQKRELEIQNRTAQLQRFENSFFHLLEVFNNSLVEIEKNKIYSQHVGRESSLHLFIQNRITDIYSKNFTQFQQKSLLNHYILYNYPVEIKRLIAKYYGIIDFIYINNSFIDNKNIIKYIKILNFNLRNQEYVLFFYDAIYNNDKKNLINKLNIFAQYSLLDKQYTPVQPEHILFFSPQAFGEDYEEYIERHGLQGKTLEDFLQ